MNELKTYNSSDFVFSESSSEDEELIVELSNKFIKYRQKKRAN